VTEPEDREKPGAGIVDNAVRARSFGSAAAAYAAYRPDYPAAAIDAAVPASAGAVLDLGAGTGKLTAGLIRPGRTVHAVEPDPDMLAQLTSHLPAVDARLGRAERIPLPDGAVDVVTVGQALHWFDLDVALPEIRRVLRPGGRLAMFWNTDDQTDPLGHALSQVIHGTFARHLPPIVVGEPDPAPFTGRDAFADPVLTTTAWDRPISRDDVHRLEDTKSWMITAPADVAARVHVDLDEVLDRFGVRDELVLRHLCHVWVAVRR
jgi:SAM-dependent methyltransferase